LRRAFPMVSHVSSVSTRERDACACSNSSAKIDSE
jgi:hypothetical protein